MVAEASSSVSESDAEGGEGAELRLASPSSGAFSSKREGNDGFCAGRDLFVPPLVFMLQSVGKARVKWQGKGESSQNRQRAISRCREVVISRQMASARDRLWRSWRSNVARSTARMLPMHQQKVHASVCDVPWSRSFPGCACTAGRQNTRPRACAREGADAIVSISRCRARPDTALTEMIGGGIG